MSYVTTQSERIVWRSVPLATPAWECTDLSVLWNTTEYRGGDVTVPYAPGVRAGRRVVESRRVVIPMVVFGNADAEGTPHSDAREGLRDNLDTLAALMRPGEGTLDVLMPDGSTRRATAHPVGSLQVRPVGPGAVRCVLDLLIPEGVFRATSATTATSSSISGGSTGTLTVDNPGSAEQTAVTLTLSGTATSVTIRNTTHPDSPQFVLATNLASGSVVVDTRDYTAKRSSTSVAGSLTPSGNPNWLPLLPGSNTIQIQPTGGTCTLAVSHYAAFL